MVASFVDGALFMGLLLPALRAEGAAPDLRSPRLDARDPQDSPSWSELRARMRAQAPDPAHEADLRRLLWVQTLLFFAGVAWADVRLDGRTRGRVLAGIRLACRDGTPLTVSQALLRESAPVCQLATDALLRITVPDDPLVRRLVVPATAFAVLPFVLLDRERRTLGDRLAGTRLILVRT